MVIPSVFLTIFCQLTALISLFKRNGLSLWGTFLCRCPEKLSSKRFQNLLSYPRNLWGDFFFVKTLTIGGKKNKLSASCCVSKPRCLRLTRSCDVLHADAKTRQWTWREVGGEAYNSLFNQPSDWALQIDFIFFLLLMSSQCRQNGDKVIQPIPNNKFFRSSSINSENRQELLFCSSTETREQTRRHVTSFAIEPGKSFYFLLVNRT